MGSNEETIKMNFFIKEAQAALDKAKAIANKHSKSFEFEGQTYSGIDNAFMPKKQEEYWMGSGGDTWSC